MAEYKKEIYGLIRVPSTFLYDEPGDAMGTPPETPTDELLSGWAVALSNEAKDGWVYVRAHYGYEGWLWAGHMRTMSRQELENRETLAVALPFLDIREGTRVQARTLETLPRNAFVTLAPEQPEEGWSQVISAGGAVGFVRPAVLRKRTEDDRFLLAGAADTGIFGQMLRERLEAVGEEALREGIVRSAMTFLGAQYRWSGKSPAGIDCSGLAFLSHMEQGILIYRDANILPDYPVREIPRKELKKGDLIFFPGHVAVCLGEGKYLHATAYAPTPCVTINSLNPGEENYREDLAGMITACGSVF